MVNVWWVNQSQKLNGRVANEIVWAPSRTVNGGKQDHWERMKEVRPGDIIIHNSNQRVVAISVSLTVARLADNPFPNDGVHHWIKEGREIRVKIDFLEVPIPKTDIPLSVRQAASLKGQPFMASGKSVKQGYLYRVPDALWNEIKSLGGIPDQGSDIASVEDTNLQYEGSSDIARIVNGRKEQTQLRKSLLGGRSAEICGICGKERPAKYLVAAHIKKRATASEKERKDRNIAMLACVFGCDQAFECGDLLVDGSGSISLRDPDDPFLITEFGDLQGKKAHAFSEHNSKYFKARFDSFKAGD